MITTQNEIRIAEDNGSFYVVVDGARWARSTIMLKAEEIAAFLHLAASDPDIELLRQ